VGGQEQHRAAALDEGDQRDGPEGDLVRQDDGGQAADRQHADAVGRDHQPPGCWPTAATAGG